MSLGGLEIPNTGYDPTALALDAATKAGVTCFVAAGNEQGSGTVSSPGCAKDVITVGASTENSGIFYLYTYWPTEPSNVTGYENSQMIFWSSEGPTADGRLDPDICAPGAWGETLARSNATAYLQFGGTSMATPIAAGVGALVYQAYKQAHGVFPSPAVVREILMNTATNLGYPANRQGAGCVNATKAVLAALGEAPYSSTDEINTGILPAGQSYTTYSTFTGRVNSAQATQLQYVSSMNFNGLSVPTGYANGTGDTWLTLTIPAGISYADVRVKFDPVITFGTPIRSYNGSTWTNVHIDATLYYERSGPNDLVLLDYAYAHTNVQWFDARIDFGPGTYVLRLWNQYATISPVDVQVNLYKSVPWSWVGTISRGSNLLTAVSIPRGTAPGIYSGFVNVTVNGSQICIPVVTSVPAVLGQTFTLQANVSAEPQILSATSNTGDWFYIPVWVPGAESLMLTATWTTSDADLDVFLVNPAGHVQAAAEAPAVPVVEPGGGGYEWYTTTGTTMDVLSTTDASPGYWYAGIQAIYFGNTFSQTIKLNLGSGTPINTPDSIYLRSGTSQILTVSNNIPGTVHVQAMALSFATETYAMPVIGNVTSFGATASAVGYDLWSIPVTPDMITMTVKLSWAGTHSLSLVLLDPFGGTAGVVSTNGGSLTIIKPVIGYWYALVTINDVGSQPYKLTVMGLRFQQLAGVTITPTDFTLAPRGTQTLTISTAPRVSEVGQIVYFDMYTGSTYPSTLLFIGPQPIHGNTC